MSQGSLAAHADINRRRLFLGSFFALVATAFGFVIRTQILDDWRSQFNLSETHIGTLNGVGLFPFAITIILFSLIVDKIGYGRTMVFAFVCHASSAVITFCAPLMLNTDPNATAQQIAHGQEMGYWMLYIGTFVLALGNGTVEAVVNPVVATIYEKNKTHWLNILHAGWPGGLVLGGVLAIYSGQFIGNLPTSMGNLTIAPWQWKVALVLLPTLIYGILFLGQKFPVQERVAAGVSYMQMLKQFGALSCFIVSFLLVLGIDQIASVFLSGSSITEFGFLNSMVEKLIEGGRMPLILGRWIVLAGIALIPTLIFLVAVRALGRAMFVFLLLIMVLLATTELGVDSWIADIMKSILGDKVANLGANAGNWVLIYTSAIMFVLRFFAGPIVHRISPLGLLATCAALAAGGILWLSSAGSGLYMVFAAATLYGIGKSFFWPTTLGVVSEQYPKGGALLLNAIAGVGMISVGVLGNPAIGVVQDKFIEQNIQQNEELASADILTPEQGLIGEYEKLDQAKLKALPEAEQELVDSEVGEAKRMALRWMAVLPAIMFICYVMLILYFRSRGGYKPQEITAEA